jgi:HD-GYP domain-containing protein (c-di-GMP phosphodiesterase class II)/DNA-binding CsgD family transcriptional regulator
VFRLLGLLGGLSVVTDMGTGAPIEESLKRAAIAARVGRAAGVGESDVGNAMYASLLQHLGCTAYAHQAADVWGDDVATNRLAFLTDFTDSRDVWRTWVAGVADATGRSRARVIATTLTRGRKVDAEGPASTCDVAQGACRQLGLPEPVQRSLSEIFAMWNGEGYPAVRGIDISLSTRLLHVASTAVLFAHHAGFDAAVREVRRRAGRYLDPDLADLFASQADELLADLDEMDAYQVVLDSEPGPVRLIDRDALEPMARTFGSLADLKSPWLYGHSAAVGDLAGAAAGSLQAYDQVADLRIAGYLHDLGRVGVSSRIWDKPGPLSHTERDQARLHPYHSERILSRVPELSRLAMLVGQHHERSDGTGYHRGLTSVQLTMPSRILAAADSYRCLVEARPHRPSLTESAAAERLQAQARAGELDADAVAAVLSAGGLRRGQRTIHPAGLTVRQVEVLRLVAAGSSNRDIAERLVISTRTAEHHVQDIYLKIGASTRAGAALYAMEHGLLDKTG